MWLCRNATLLFLIWSKTNYSGCPRRHIPHTIGRVHFHPALITLTSPVSGSLSYRYQEFKKAREALLNGDTVAAQEAAGRMPTGPEGFVGSFEYAGELHLEFGGGSEGSGGGGKEPLDQAAGRGGVDGYIRHLHLNNATGESA